MERTIVVGIDGSACSRVAVDWAVGEAGLRGLPLRVAHVSSLSAEEALAIWPYCPEPTPDAWVKVLAGHHPALRIESVGLTGETVPALLSVGTRADLMVLGMRGAGGFTGLAVGSVAHGVAALGNLPVVLVPDRPAPGGRRPHAVTVGIDARRPAAAALDFAFDAAERRGALLLVVHAWRLPSPAARWMPFALPEEDRGAWEDQEVQQLSDVLGPWREKHPHVRVHEDVRLKSPSSALVQASACAELLVVGRTGTSLGPTLHAVVDHAECPVVVVPS
ncbi:universal stress protein [Streptomyces sp. NBC_00878]|uniref:universal stress protein n=1 Tax=Streptomyces sp. NBC_00878 TaxID=2975854 RepID=UPI00225A1F41|nr:universal stress protein [Streptomyces sp. NBC_00878]MCX4903756.1 universal stress protein [Streptomyces sp. NBC_00878]